MSSPPPPPENSLNPLGLNQFGGLKIIRHDRPPLVVWIVYCTAALTSLSQSISDIKSLFSEWHIAIKLLSVVDNLLSVINLLKTKE